jgi:hypothetical protein
MSAAAIPAEQRIHSMTQPRFAVLPLAIATALLATLRHER